MPLRQLGFLSCRRRSSTSSSSPIRSRDEAWSRKPVAVLPRRREGGRWQGLLAFASFCRDHFGEGWPGKMSRVGVWMSRPMLTRRSHIMAKKILCLVVYVSASLWYACVACDLFLVVWVEWAYPLPSALSKSAVPHFALKATAASGVLDVMLGEPAHTLENNNGPSYY